jgi:hypothetical protein
MTLITTSYPNNVFLTKPNWIDILKENSYIKSNSIAVYDPSQALIDNEDNLRIIEALSRSLSSNITVKQDVGKPFDEVKDILFRSNDTLYSSEIEFQSQYIISRSDLLIVDLNEPSYGRSIVDICYANSVNVPVIGILHKCVIDPLVQSRVNALVSINSIDDIIRQILAYTLMNQFLA